MQSGIRYWWVLEKEHGRTGWWFAVAGGPCRVTSGNFLIEGQARWGRLTWP